LLLLLLLGIKQRFIGRPVAEITRIALGAHRLPGGHGKEIISFMGSGTELFSRSGRGKFEI